MIRWQWFDDGFESGVEMADKHVGEGHALLELIVIPDPERDTVIAWWKIEDGVASLAAVEVGRC